jgi:hypothetical protein
MIAQTEISKRQGQHSINKCGQRDLNKKMVGNKIFYY